jgi:hypothetical protein
MIMTDMPSAVIVAVATKMASCTDSIMGMTITHKVIGAAMIVTVASEMALGANSGMGVTITNVVIGVSVIFLGRAVTIMVIRTTVGEWRHV